MAAVLPITTGRRLSGWPCGSILSTHFGRHQPVNARAGPRLSSRHRCRPGCDARRKCPILGGLDRHCGAFAEGAVKQKLLARRFRELVQKSHPSPDFPAARRRARGESPGMVPCRSRSAARADQPARCPTCPPRTSLRAPKATSRGARSPLDAGPHGILAGTATSIILGFGSFRLFIRRDIFVRRFDLQSAG